MPSDESSRVQAVLFDYGLVLTGPPAPAAWQRMKSVFRVDEPIFHEAYWKPRPDYDKGVLQGREYWNEVARLLDRRLTAAETEALLQADVDLWTEPNQEMIDWAFRLQARGIRTGILSNLGDAMEAGVRARCTWLQDFHHHTFSHRLLLAKPDPAIYSHAAEGLDTPPKAILFVDDRAENIDAARAAGMLAVQYTSHAEFLRSMDEQGLSALL